MITETVVTTVAPTGKVHIAPMGVREADGRLLLAPFRPSTTLDNLLETERAVINLIDDVRVFAGCVTKRQREWPTEDVGDGRVRLACALVHRELSVDEVEPDDQRPRIWCRQTAAHTHAPFAGFNRAQAAVVEGAILASRLSMLPQEKITNEVAYLRIAIDKTAGPRELEAWTWVMDAIDAHLQATPAT
ncbi:MAG: DUF447 domain-containing protein [Pseudomonadota bacterium]